MKWARFIGSDGRIAYGFVEGGQVREVAGSPLVAWEETDVLREVDDLRLLAPVLPTKVVAVTGNYGAPTEEPVIFLKPSTAVIGPAEAIRLPRAVGRIQHQGELAVVIGKVARAVRPHDAGTVVFGYTGANDVTAADLQERDGQWGRAKGFDTFCPLGPIVETDLDPLDVAVLTRVNGDVVGDGVTTEMNHGVAELISFVSSVMTLLPGDVILTGCAYGGGPLEAGDVVEVDVEGVGVLRNPAKAAT